MLKSHFGARLKFIRSLRKMTQDRLAEACDVTKEHLSRIERGKSAPSFEMLDRLCGVLQTAPANLFLFPENGHSAPPRRQRKAAGGCQTGVGSPSLPELFILGWGTWLIDLQTDREEWSSPLSRLLGYSTPCAPSLKAFVKHLRPEDVTPFTDFYHTLRAGLAPAGLSFGIVRKDGVSREIRIHSDMLTDSTGSPHLVCLTVADVSELRALQRCLLVNLEQLETVVAEKTHSLLTAAQAMEKELVRRKDTEEQLRVFQDMVESASDAIIFLDRNGIYRVANPRYGDLFGVSPEAIPGRHVSEVVGQEVFGQVKPLLDRAFAGERVSFQRWQPQGKGARYLDVTYGPHRDGKRIVGVVAILRDLTQKEYARQDLEMYRHAVESSQAAISMADPSGKITHVNPTFLRMWGYDDLEEVLGRQAVEFWTDPQAAVAVLAELRLLRPWQGWLTGRRRDGSPFTARVTASPLLDRTGELLGYTASFADETERLASEERLKESERRGRTLLDATPAAVALISPQGIIEELNEQFARNFHAERQALLGRCVWDLMPPEVAAPRQRHAEEVVRTGTPRRHRDFREEMWIDYAKYPLFNDTGEVDQIAIFAQDVTELIHTRQTLRECVAENIRLRQALAEGAHAEGARNIEANEAGRAMPDHEL